MAKYDKTDLVPVGGDDIRDAHPFSREDILRYMKSESETDEEFTWDDITLCMIVDCGVFRYWLWRAKRATGPQEHYVFVVRLPEGGARLGMMECELFAPEDFILWVQENLIGV